MTLSLSPADEAFRQEVREFLATYLTPDIRRSGSRMTSVYADHTSQMAWQAILHAKGWAAPGWPTEYGGAGWSGDVGIEPSPVAFLVVSSFYVGFPA